MTTLTYRDISLSAESCTLSCGQYTLHLRKLEFLLLHFLINHSGRAVPRIILLRTVWGYASDFIRTNTLETHIFLLRKKLRFLESTCAITTVSKFGYRLE